MQGQEDGFGKTNYQARVGIQTRQKSRYAVLVDLDSNLLMNRHFIGLACKGPCSKCLGSTNNKDSIGVVINQRAIVTGLGKLPSRDEDDQAIQFGLEFKVTVCISR